MDIGGALRERFSRLYNISLDKNRRISEMGEWEGDRWNWSRGWRRPFFDKDLQSFNEFKILIDRKQHINVMEDSWKWRSSEDGKYSAKETYLIIFNQNRTTLQNSETTSGFKQIWKSFAPSKVKAHAWRFL
ncbi:hypothetical protein ACS0TY_023686 [Phlomoides rotata]